MRTSRGVPRWATLAAVLVAVVFMSVPAFGYRVGAEVTSGGGGESTSPSYKAHDTVAQAPIGPVGESTNYKGYDGFWMILPSTTTPVDGSFYGDVGDGGAVVLRWTVSSLYDVVGLNVYRATSEEGPFELLNEEPLEPASPGSFEDTGVWPETTFWYELRVVLTDGTEDVVVGSPAMVKTEGKLSLALYPASPNPFGDATSVRFDVPDHVGAVSLVIYNVRGQVVRRLVDEPMDRGRYERAWDGRDDSGAQVAAGVYFSRLIVDDKSERQKMMLLK
ncbi:MAG: FlgD immunoglobulin-like domain containing protein [Candidatus Eisenbacteria bacterium]